MHLSDELIKELEILASFNLSTTMMGIKVHREADPGIIAAVQRLHDKKLLSQVDGGYLTDLGLEVAEHLQSAIRILEPSAS